MSRPKEPDNKIKMDYLEKMIDTAKEKLTIDIKKLQHLTNNWFRNNQGSIVSL